MCCRCGGSHYEVPTRVARGRHQRNAVRDAERTLLRDGRRRRRQPEDPAVGEWPGDVINVSCTCDVILHEISCLMSCTCSDRVCSFPSLRQTWNRSYCCFVDCLSTLEFAWLQTKGYQFFIIIQLLRVACTVLHSAHNISRVYRTLNIFLFRLF